MLKHVELYLALMLSVLVGCGGGGGSGTTISPVSTPDFAVSATPATVSATSGASATVSVAVSAVNGFSNQVTVQLTGLPSGVTALPASFVLLPGKSQQIVLSAAASATAATTNVIVSASSANLTHSTGFALTVSLPKLGSFQSLGRTHYVRTDSTTLYEGSGALQFTVFDSLNQRFFVADPSSNRITVFDAKTQQYLGSIPVPGALGIDESPDHKTLYAGTQIGDLYAIDPAAMTVTRRYIGGDIGSYGYAAYAVRVLANGRLVLLGGQGGIPSVDGYSSIGVWDPNANKISFYATAYGGSSEFGFSGIPYTTVCGPATGIFGFTLTGDRTHIVLGSSTLCLIDPSTGADIYSSNPVVSTATAPTPDGRYIVAQSNSGGQPSLVVFDATTLNVVRQFPAQGTQGVSSFLISPDSSTIYLTTSSILYAYDLATGAQTGWSPNIYLPDGFSRIGSGSSGLNLGAIDETGLLAGPMSEGVGFLDTATLRTGPVGSQFLNNYLSPATGPATGGTQVGFSGSGTVPLTGLTFAGQEAGSPTVTNAGQITATTPAGKPGPADVSSYFADGSAEILPEAFSYGPSILQVLTNVTTADGGGTGYIFGYGFGLTNATTIPADLTITVGGKPATITGFYPNAYGSYYPPFLLQGAVYTIPPSAAGSQDVTLSTSSGSTTVAAAMQTIPAPQQFPLAGAALAQGIYDPHRDLYYFTDATRIQTFSKTKGTWLTPVAIAPPAGATKQRLWGIALSPDGSKLAIGDIGADAIYLLDPTNLSAVMTYPLPTPPSGTVTSPAGLAISDNGVIYFAQATYGGTGYDGFFNLDTNTGKFTDLRTINQGLPSSPGLTTDQYLRAVISSDNARVFFNDDGLPFSLDTATGEVTYASSDPGCCYGDYDLSLSSNQTSFAATGYLYDSDLNAGSYVASGKYAPRVEQYVYGEKLSPDGSLLFQPSVNGIDVFDGRAGTLRQSIALPFALSQSFDALVADGRDNFLIAITGATGRGIAVVDLTSLQEPAPLPYSNQARLRANQLISSPSRMSHGTGTRGKSVPHAMIPLGTEKIEVQSSSRLLR